MTYMTHMTHDILDVLCDVIMFFFSHAKLVLPSLLNAPIVHVVDVGQETSRTLPKIALHGDEFLGISRSKAHCQ